MIHARERQARRRSVAKRDADALQEAPGGGAALQHRRRLEAEGLRAPSFECGEVEGLHAQSLARESGVIAPVLQTAEAQALARRLPDERGSSVRYVLLFAEAFNSSAIHSSAATIATNPWK